MATIPLLIAALSLAGQAPDRHQQADEPATLAKFIGSMHWDPAKSGPLIALDTESVLLNDKAPMKLSGFERKMVKVGGLNAIVQSWTTTLKDEDIPNAYDALSDDDKITFLLATLRPGELKALYGDGICARDLSGQQKAALLSLIAQPFTYREGQTEGPGGFRSNKELETVPDDQRDRIRVQFHKGVMVTHSAQSNGKGGTMSRGLGSLEYRGPSGTTVVQSGEMRAFRKPAAPGRIVDNVEKKSDLSWTDPRLAKQVHLKLSTVGEAVDAIRDLTGIEVYAEYRIAGRDLNPYGPSCSAGDLLRALTWALCGVVRKVGPAYVLTANKEGKGSLEVRLGAIVAQGQIAIHSEVDGWRQTVANANLLQTVPIAHDDAFRAGSISESLIAPPNTPPTASWVPLSQVPDQIKSAIDDSAAALQANAKRQADFHAQHPELPGQRGVARDEGWTPIDSLAGMAKISWELGYRFVLPDGRPLEYRNYRTGGQFQNRLVNGSPPREVLPLDVKQIKAGGGVAVRSDDPRAVVAMCKQIKDYGIGEVWLETHSPAAIEAAASSGLIVDLIIRPWLLTKGEPCSDPDKNLTGLTGSKLATIPGARFDPTDPKVAVFGDSIAPADPGLSAHWGRLAQLASTKGVHRVVLLDTMPNGYWPPTNMFRGLSYSIGPDGKEIPHGLPSLAPKLFEFGYSTAQRVDYLRAHKIDPIDLPTPNQESVGPIDPYFDAPRMMGSSMQTLYSGVHFPMAVVRIGDTEVRAWSKYLNGLVMKQFSGLGESLSKVCDSVMMEQFFPDNPTRFSGPVRFIGPFTPDGKLDWKTASANFMSLSPLSSEDDQGKLFFRANFLPSMDQPFCFDLTDVPPDRVPVYLRFLLKPAK